MSKIELPLFNMHERALENEYGACPDCGGKLLIKHSKKGAFLGCNNYPQCQYIRGVTQQHENIDDQLIDGAICPNCNNNLVVRSGRFGLFICCIDYPQCQYIDKNNQSNDVAEVPCPKCKTGVLEAKTNRFGKTFYACNHYPKCKFLVNYPPYNEPCPDCGFGILVARKTAAGKRLECPQKQCKYKRKLAEPNTHNKK